MMSTSYLDYERLLSISHDEGIRQNSLFQDVRSFPVPSGAIEVAIPNYNNIDLIGDVIHSHLSHRLVENIGILIYDNCSDDGSWEKIQALRQLYSGIRAIQLPINTGPHTSFNLALRSPSSKYTLFASGNDIIIDRNLLAQMYAYLEESCDIDLVYARNCRNHRYSEPAAHTFTIPGPHRRKLLGLSDIDCMNMAALQYTSSEPLWGLYRSSSIKSVPSIESYGNDHFIVSAMALLSGITGLMLPFREVTPERRTHDDLRRFQIQAYYTTGSHRLALLPPLNSTSFLSLAYTYYQGIQRMICPGLNVNLLTTQILEILSRRFAHLLVVELSDYNMLHSNYTKMLHTAESDSIPLHVKLAIDSHHAFVRRVFTPVFKLTFSSYL